MPRKPVADKCCQQLRPLVHQGKDASQRVFVNEGDAGPGALAKAARVRGCADDKLLIELRSLFMAQFVICVVVLAHHLVLLIVESNPVDLVNQDIAAFTSAATFFSTTGVHFVSAYDTGQKSPSSTFAASWKPRVEYLYLNLPASWKKTTTLPSAFA